MDEEETRAELQRLVHRHKVSAAHLTNAKQRTNRGETAGFELILAVTAEASARKALLDWKAPTPKFAIEKLLHLLAHVIINDLPFDDLSLEAIQEELYRLRGQ